MAKHTGITIRIGATQDSVTITDKTKGSIHFDRAEMRTSGNGKLMGALRRTVVEAFTKQQRQHNART